MAQSLPTHDAFISYSRRDAAFARVLQKKLQAYTPPRDLDLQRRRLNIFRDEEDLDGTEYNEAVRGHLKRSRKLIVICSPAARASRYVDEEIRTFAESNGTDHVIPVLVSGIPNNEAGEGRESELAFPAALCDIKAVPLAASYRDFDETRHRPDRGAYAAAWFTLLANLYDISRSDIEQRDKRRQARVRRVWIAGTAGVMISLAALAGWALVARSREERQRIRAESSETVAQQQRDVARAAQSKAEQAAAFEKDARTQADIERGNAERSAAAAIQARREAERQRDIAVSRQLAVLAALPRNQERNEIERGALLAMESLRRYPNADAARIAYAALAILPTKVASFRHSPAPTANLAFTSDGSRIVSVRTDRTSIVYDVEKDRTYTGPPHGDGGFGGLVDLSRDGRLLATVIPGEGLMVADPASNTIRARAPAIAKLDRLSFSANGTRLLGVVNRSTDPRQPRLEMWVWDSASLAEIVHVSDQDFRARMLTGDGSGLVATASSGVVQILELPSLNVVRTLSDGRDGRSITAAYLGSPERRAIAESSDRTRVALAHGKEVTILDGRTGEVVGNLPTEPADLALSPNGQVLAVNHVFSLEMWDVKSRRRLALVSHDGQGIDGLAFSPDGKRLGTAGRDGTARIWDVSTGRELARVVHADDVDAVGFSPDGKRMVSASSDGEVRITELVDGGELPAPAGLGRPPVLAGTVAGLRTATVRSGAVRLIDAETGRQVAQRNHDDKAETEYQLAIAPDGRRFASAASQYWMYGRGKPTVRVWQTDREHAERARMEVAHVVNAVAFSADGTHVAAGGHDAIAYVWDASTGRELARLPNTEEIQVLALSPGGRLLATAGGDITRKGIWDREALRIWDVPHRRLLHTLRHGANVYAVAFSGDGRRLAAAGGDRTARVYDPATGAELARMFHDSDVNALAFSPDGMYVATGNEDGSVRVWDIARAQQVSRIDHQWPVWAVAFDADGRRLATISGNEIQNRTVHLWIWRTRDVIAELCTRLTRNLTDAEWAEYFTRSDPYRTTCATVSSISRQSVPPRPLRE